MALHERSGTSMTDTRKVVILGAAGRDFHNFNMLHRGDAGVRVVAFTAAQIPGIAGRRYPPELAGPGYHDGIRIIDEADLVAVIRDEQVDEVVFSYSDVTHSHVMHLASACIAAGANVVLPGGSPTMLRSSKPVVAVTAVRTGAGKSQTSRYIARLLRERGLVPVVVRHPMPYGDLTAQAVQRYQTLADLDRHECTIEEREEYEPHLAVGMVVYAGVDYERILRQAEGEADVIIWDGGNNDLPFFAPDLHLVVVDPLRPGDELAYHPGEANLRMADVVVVNKCDAATPDAISTVEENIRSVNPSAPIVRADSPVTVDDPDAVRGRRVVVVEDGPTLTHGSMAFGAGVAGARAAGAAEIVNPASAAVGTIAETYIRYPHAVGVIPAMGYGEAQVRDLAATIEAVDCDIVVSGTPIDLAGLVSVSKPIVRARYELREQRPGALAALLADALAKPTAGNP